jgi:hypothetical protein
VVLLLLKSNPFTKKLCGSVRDVPDVPGVALQESLRTAVLTMLPHTQLLFDTNTVYVCPCFTPHPAGVPEDSGADPDLARRFDKGMRHKSFKLKGAAPVKGGELRSKDQVARERARKAKLQQGMKERAEMNAARKEGGGRGGRGGRGRGGSSRGGGGGGGRGRGGGGGVGGVRGGGVSKGGGRGGGRGGSRGGGRGGSRGGRGGRQ